jgi:hypothetical protein
MQDPETHGQHQQYNNDNLTGEIWLPVPGYEAQYEVSSFGRVRSRRWDRKFLSLAALREGYPVVTLCYGGNCRSENVHRIVLAAFRGEPPTRKHVSRHLDGNQTNNRLDNLAWGTQKENIADARRHGTMARGSRAGASVLTESGVAEIAVLISKGVSDRVIADRFGMSESAIWGIRSGKSWGWLTGIDKNRPRPKRTRRCTQSRNKSGQFCHNDNEPNE